MIKSLFVLISIYTICLIFPWTVAAEDYSAADAAVDSSVADSDLVNNQPVADAPAAPGTKSPGKPRFSFGYDQRFRNEIWTNIQDQNANTKDDKKWNTFRQRLWINIPLGTDNVQFYVRLLSQFTKTSTPSIPLNWDEVIVDNAYLSIKKFFLPGLSVKVGRQDISFGEGFVLMDGSACDGPRTSYFNAMDITYAYKGSKLDLIGILDPRQDRLFPVIHNQHKYLNESDEQAVVLYYRERNLKKTDLDFYYFLKKEIRDYRSAANPQFQPDRHINTVGTRIVHRFEKGFTATGEMALQRGRQHPDTRISAWSAYGYLKKQFDARLSPYVLGGYWALSGDNPFTSGTYEGWDPLFARWPKWGGMYPWSQVPEKGIGYWTNIKMVQLETGFTPWKPLTLKGVLYLNDAFHPYARGKPSIFSTGTHRGAIPEFLAFYKFSNTITGEFRYEILAPGNFYTGRDTGQFFRFEFNYSFRHPSKRAD
jgi:hypothetical protein